MKGRMITKPLPHKIGVADIANPELKRVAMLFMENFKALDTRIAALERAWNNQKKGG